MANLRQTIAVGSTGEQLVSAFNANASNSNLRIYNVEDYGAVHDGTTDDTVAIQATITACNVGGGGVIYFPIGIYVIGGALVGTTGGTTYNSQLIIPFVTNNDETRKTFHLLGEVVPNFSQSVGINVSGMSLNTPSTGVILKSTIVGSGTNPSVICAGAYNTEDTIWALGNANQIVIENIQIQPVVDESNRVTIGALNMRGAMDITIKNVCCYPFNLNLVDSGIPQNNCVGIALPSTGNGNFAILENVNVGGFETGFLIGEHSSLHNTQAICCLYGYQARNAGHPIYGTRVMTHWCANSIIFGGNNPCIIKIDELVEEPLIEGGKWYDFVSTITDSTNKAHGIIYYNCTGGANYNPHYTKVGGANLQCIPIAFAAASSFTVTGSTDAEKVASIIAVLEAKGLIIDGTT